MLTTAQKNKLYGQIGETSIFKNRLFSHSMLDQGTKVLLLERALTQSSNEFEKTLDKLYASLQTSKLKTTLILIYGLKYINDLVHNNKPKYAGERTAVDFHFTCGRTSDPGAVKGVVQRIVSRIIASLNSRYGKDKISEQKAAYSAAESETANDSSWNASEQQAREPMLLAALDNEERSISFFNPQYKLQPISRDLKPTIELTPNAGVTYSYSFAEMFAILAQGSKSKPSMEEDNSTVPTLTN